MELRARLADLYCSYDDAVNEGELERWPGFFTPDCTYKVIPRENYEQGYPLALVYCESRDMLMDRVVAIRETALFAPRIARRITSGICLRAIEQGTLSLTANFAVFQTMADNPSELFLCGRCHDRVADEGGRLLFVERLCIFDSSVVPTSLVYPI